MGCSLTLKGKQRAKNILLKKFGKQSEVVNTHIQGVMKLLAIQNYRLDVSHMACWFLIRSTLLSLNDCLERDLTLQNCFGVSIRSRFRPIVLCEGVEKAFLQIAIEKEDEDVLRFHWFNIRN